MIFPTFLEKQFLGVEILLLKNQLISCFVAFYAIPTIFRIKQFGGGLSKIKINIIPYFLG